MAKFIIRVILLAVFYQIAWHSAHRTIAKECDSQGSFYVNERLFVCKFEKDWR